MSRVLYVDVVGGAAGDMLLAALIDAGASLEAVRDAVERVIPGRFEFDTVDVRRAGLRARLLDIRTGPRASSAELVPRSHADLEAAVERAGLPSAIEAAARAVLAALGRAEARVHGAEHGAGVALHALGDDDTLLDVVGIAAALAALDVGRMLVSPVPLGAAGRPAAPAGGQAPYGGSLVADGHGHGAVPMPAPATLELLTGFEVRGEGAGETVTPTAAAVFAALGEPAPRFPGMRVEAVGYGAGNDDPRDRSNVVRVVLGAESATAGPEVPVRELVVLEANLDDLIPELVADAAQALLGAGALDAWTTQVQMKKGRPGVVLSALVDPADEPRIRAMFFEATSTFGVRSVPVRRAELDRRVALVPVAGGTVRVKVGLFQRRVVSATPEHDDVAALASRLGRPTREVYEEAAAAARELRYSDAGTEPGA